ncbi:hypothetical protein QFZ66_006115 [Streptomyces sp. B4I13]|uniref:Uncharacterized protein n=1 Tax=Streptomyces achromogenes TaxID=67255 RepID=A0ABU0PYI7_STRAH|nr:MULTISPECIES: hypothetical protein [Streptomyces]MDQ0683470.1 hypothetical protein [Streptomyces achromogenes]MDQ0830648.1 hypothetical protein [Streptomyces achromogenes]MDQ0962237.1 hypothetical protein [Streptomyces sp. B4I13]
MNEQESSATVLAASGNFAVVRLPDRRYPALAVQGDSLKVLQETVEELASYLGSGDLEEAGFSLAEIRSTVSSMLSTYETASNEAGFDLPYVR